MKEDWFSVCRKITRLRFKGEVGKRGANTPLAGHKVKKRGAQWDSPETWEKTV